MKLHIPLKLLAALLACVMHTSFAAGVVTIPDNATDEQVAVAKAELATPTLTGLYAQDSETYTTKSSYQLVEVTGDVAESDFTITKYLKTESNDLHLVTYNVEFDEVFGDASGDTTYYFAWAEDEDGNRQLEATLEVSEADVVYRNNASNISTSRLNTSSDWTNRDDIDGSFMGCNITSTSSAAYGGAIYNSAGIIGDISGDFVGNYAYSESSIVRGGAIYNSGTIGNITGNFIANYSSSSSSSYSEIRGAIYNSGLIGDITGYFISNYASSSHGCAYGGAISNSGTIGNITGDFIANYSLASSDSTNTSNSSAAYGGAIYNSGLIGDITGDFISNYASSSHGCAYGGAIRNSGTIGNITGDFIGNYTDSSNSADSAYYYSRGGAISNVGNGIIGDITGDFIGNYSYSAFIHDSSYGGAICNYSYTISSSSIIGNITGDFIGNYTYSESYYSCGGAICNSASVGSSTIGNITGDFIGNYAYSESSIACGGAIYNFFGEIGNITGDFINNYAYSQSGNSYGGAIYNNGTITSITDSCFTNNSASNGGAIYNASSGLISLYSINTDVLFSGNTANDVSNAIYNYGTVNMDAMGDSYRIIFEDAITGYTGSININSQGGVGTVELNNAVSSNSIYLGNGTIELGYSSVDDGTNACGAITLSTSYSLSSDAFTITGNSSSSVLTIVDGSTTASISYSANDDASQQYASFSNIDLGTNSISFEDNSNVSLNNTDMSLSEETLSSLSATDSTLSLDDCDITGELSLVDSIATATGSLSLGGATINSNSSLKVDGALDAEGATIDNNGSLSFGEGSIIGSITGSGTNTATGDATIGSLDAASSLVIEGSDTEVTVQSDTTLAGLSNEGTLNLDGNDLTLTTETSTGGTVIADDITLTGDNSFTSITATGDVSGSDKLTLNADSTIGGSLSTDSLVITAGDVSIGSISGELSSLSNGTGTLSIGSDLTVTGEFSNDGTLDMSGYDLTLGTTTTNGGIVIVNNITMTGENIFESLTVTGSITNDGDLELGEGSDVGHIGGSGTTTVTGDTNIDSMSDGSELVIEGEDTTVKINDDTVLGSLDNDGTLDLGDNKLTIESGTDNGGNIIAGELDLTGDNFFDSVSVSGNIDSSGSLSVSDDSSAGSLTGGGSLSIEGEDTEFTIGDDTTLAGLDNDGTLNLGDNMLTLESGTDNGGKVIAGELELTGDNSFDSVSVSGNVSGGDSISLAEDSTIGGNLTLESTDLTVDDGAKLTVGSVQADEDSSISGKLTIEGDESSELFGSYKDASIDAQTSAAILIDVSGDKARTLRLAGTDANITLTGVDGGSLNSFNLSNSSLSLQSFTTGESLTLTETSTLEGGTLEICVSSSLIGSGSDTALITGAALELGGVTLVLTSSDNAGITIDKSTLGTTDVALLVLTDDENSWYDSVTVDLGGSSLSKYFTNVSYVDGVIYADLKTDIYNSLAETSNGAVGLSMMSTTTVELNPQSAPLREQYRDLALVLDELDRFLQAGNSADADKLGAAIAGASSTALGSAAISDLERQVSSIRARSKFMRLGNTQDASAGVWLAAEGGYSELSNDGTRSGHDFKNWGGSLGYEGGFAEKWRLGAAFTAMTGDLRSNVADQLDADINNYYLSTYAYLCEKNWTHNVVMTLGFLDASFDRTVYTSTDGYRAKGDTNGASFAMAYEVGYNFYLNEDASTILQPIVGVALKHNSIDAYTESNSDAALSVGEQENTYVTLSLGAQLDTVVGEGFYNRSSVLSTRMMLNVDAGDRKVESDVSLVNGNGDSYTIKGAEPGAVGLELGVGLDVPVSESSSLFVDFSCEFRSKMTDVSGGLGYRFSF